MIKSSNGLFNSERLFLVADAIDWPRFESSQFDQNTQNIMDIATEPQPVATPNVQLPQTQPADAPILEKYFIVREVGR